MLRKLHGPTHINRLADRLFQTLRFVIEDDLTAIGQQIMYGKYKDPTHLHDVRVVEPLYKVVDYQAIG